MPMKYRICLKPSGVVAFSFLQNRTIAAEDYICPIRRQKSKLQDRRTKEKAMFAHRLAIASHVAVTIFWVPFVVYPLHTRPY